MTLGTLTVYLSYPYLYISNEILCAAVKTWMSEIKHPPQRCSARNLTETAKGTIFSGIVLPPIILLPNADNLDSKIKFYNLVFQTVNNYSYTQKNIWLNEQIFFCSTLEFFTIRTEKYLVDTIQYFG